MSTVEDGLVVAVQLGPVEEVGVALVGGHSQPSGGEEEEGVVVGLRGGEAARIGPVGGFRILDRE